MTWDEILAKYLNEWADYDKHKECSNNGYRTIYGDGYQQAVRDIFDKFDFKTILDKSLEKEFKERNRIIRLKSKRRKV